MMLNFRLENSLKGRLGEEGYVPSPLPGDDHGGCDQARFT
jgi:hypothetical protein